MLRKLCIMTPVIGLTANADEYGGLCCRHVTLLDETHEEADAAARPQRGPREADRFGAAVHIRSPRHHVFWFDKERRFIKGDFINVESVAQRNKGVTNFTISLLMKTAAPSARCRSKFDVGAAPITTLPGALGRSLISHLIFKYINNLRQVSVCGGISTNHRRRNQPRPLSRHDGLTARPPLLYLFVSLKRILSAEIPSDRRVAVNEDNIPEEEYAVSGVGEQLRSRWYS